MLPYFAVPNLTPDTLPTAEEAATMISLKETLLPSNLLKEEVVRKDAVKVPKNELHEDPPNHVRLMFLVGFFVALLGILGIIVYTTYFAK